MLDHLRSSRGYNTLSKKYGKNSFLKSIKNGIKRLFYKPTVFDAMGFKYYGPIDGHNFKDLFKYFKYVDSQNRPVVLHVVTKKGKGYKFAEEDEIGAWHCVSPFSKESGLPLKEDNENVFYSEDKFISNIDSLKVAIVNTFLVTILSTTISTIFGTMFAIGIHSFNKKHRTFFNILNNMPIVNPDIVTGFLLLLVFVLFQTLFGLERGMFTVLLSHIFFSIPYVVLSVLPRLKQIDENTYEAARDLGCGRFEAILKVVIPAISTGIISGAMFAFTMSIDDFVITMFVSGTEYFNVSTWIDSSMRRGYIPKTVKVLII